MGSTTQTESIEHARKSHSCSWCAQKIEVGQPYKRYRWFDGVDASTVKMHPECLVACDDLVSELGEIEFSPGDNPRGCTCGFDKSCGCWLTKSSSNSALITEC